jgi:thiol-disulfide isomerase/thioredoxin
MPQFTQIIYDAIFQPRIRVGINTYISPGAVIGAATALVLFILVGVYAYRRYSSDVARQAAAKDYANVPRNGAPVTVTLFYANWCPHCKSIMDEWTAFAAATDKKVVNGFVIECVKKDCSDSDDASVIAAMNANDVTHFPTLILVYKDDKTVFDSKVTSAGLATFVETKTAGFS